MPATTERECIFPECTETETDRHHVASYEKQDQPKNFVDLCSSHHSEAHNGSTQLGLVLYRKLPPEKRHRDPPTIGRGEMTMNKSTLLVDKRVEEAFDAAAFHFDEAMSAWTSHEDISVGSPYIGRFRYNSRVASELRHPFNATEREPGVYEHRTRPVQLRKNPDGKYTVHILPVYASGDLQTQVDVAEVFQDKLRRGKGMEGGRIITGGSLTRLSLRID